MPVFALYNFDDNTTVVDDAPINGIQNGIYLNGASAAGGNLVLDGVNDFAKIYPASQFQMDRGTLEINFRPTDTAMDGPQTVLSRDSAGENQGSYRVEVFPDGSVLITHETEGGSTTFSTGPDFYQPGDTINLSYSWDQGGEGGRLVIENQTTGADYSADVPAELTMDMADQSQPWILGAGQANSDPDMLNNIGDNFLGTVDFFSLSDTVDNHVPDEDPVANPDSAETAEDTPVVIDVLANDTDPNGDPLTIDGTPTAEHGTVTVNPDGTITYTPDGDYNGPDTITYTVTDPDGNTATSTVAVNVTPVNDAPDAVDDASATAIDTPVTHAVLANDTDVDGDTLTVSGTPTSAQGAVSVNPDGTLTFTPNPGFTGVATVEYSIVDEEGLSDTATWTITVGDPEAPVANPDSAETAEDTPVVIDVLANDTDPNGDPLTIDGTPTAEHGTVTVNPDGTITYTPDGDYNGPDTITYTVTDPDGNTATSTVAVNVTPVNDAPEANDDTATTTINVPVTIPVLANDTDVDGDTLSVIGAPTSPDGTVAVNPDGSLTFTPAPGFTGTTTIDYQITDGNGGTDTAQVVVTVGNGGPGRDGIVRGTDGDDLIDTSYVDPFDGDRIDANDAIIGGDGPNDDRVVAGDGDDTIISGQGSDTVFGGDGNDLIDTTGGGRAPLPDIDYPGVYPADTDPENDRDLVFGGAGDDTIRTGDDADTIHAGDGNDLVDAGIDADLVFGGDGNDTLVGNEGSDTIHGGTGDDLIYGGLDDVIGDALDIPDDAGDLRPDNNRDLLFGGEGNDTIYGRDDDDTLYGDEGDDYLDGGVDDDSLFGGAGNDTLVGGHGRDTMTGGDDRDVFIVGSGADGIGDVIDGSEGGDDYDTLDLSGAGPLRIDYDPTNPENGVVHFLDADGNETGTLTFVNIENVIPCFTPGTLIATPRGEMPVESLRPGDKVVTRDNGIQEIRWVGEKALSGQDLRLNSHLQPVFIKRGALGNGLPEQDMMVSPNHRLLVANDRTQLYFDEHEVLVAAKHLVGTQGVHAVEAIGVTYVHFMFDRHEVVLSNGAWTESFQPGDYTLKGMGNAQRSEIFELFPELKTDRGLEDYQAARRTLKRHEARLLVK